MVLVEQSERNENGTGSTAEVRAELVLDIELFDFRFALIVLRHDGMLPFQFAEDAGVLAELVTESEHGAPKIACVDAAS